MINKITIIGIGLIGGSLARALRHAGFVQEIVGFGRNINNTKLAVELGVVDYAGVSLDSAIEGAQLVVIAVPVGTIPEILSALAGRLGKTTVLTDVGSVKLPVIEQARQVLSESELTRFVPAHPIAGTEQSGVAASREDLFNGHQIVLCPTAETQASAITLVQKMWEATGANVRRLQAAHHDDVLAASSHLPHVLAYALVDMLVRKDSHRDIFDFAAGGFRDFTRIAGSDPVMWRDICLANRDPVLELLKEFNVSLDEMIQAINKRDGQWLLETFERARHARQQYIRPAPDDAPDSSE